VTELKQVFPPLKPSHRLYNLARTHGMQNYVVLKLYRQVDPDSARSRLAALPDVANVEFDAIARLAGGVVTPNDPYFATHQYALRNTGTEPPEDPGTAGADIEMEGAWEYTTGDSNVIVAITDTGIDWVHPDLLPKIWVNKDEIECDETDNDGNGYPGDYRGWNFAVGSCIIDDDYGHGTPVAGIAGAATNNGIGVAGMDWKCRLMAVKVFNGLGQGAYSWFAEGFYYAANNGANVINLSGGGDLNADVLRTATDYAVAAGVTVCAAMMNFNTMDPYYPAAYANVIAVGATDSDDQRASPFCYNSNPGSCYGPWIDVCAPGDFVWSTVRGGDYNLTCGTSFATPHVAGLASLVKALRPSFTPAQIQDIIQKGAEDQVGRPTEDTPGFDIYHGWGRINARRTLRALAVAMPPILSVPGPLTVTELDTLQVLVRAVDSNFTTPVLWASSLANAGFADSGNGVGVLTFVPDLDQQGEYAVVFIANDGALADTDQVSITVTSACICPNQGDITGDPVIDVFDVIGVIEIAFSGGADPQDPGCPKTRGDVDNNGVADVFDVIYLIATAFSGGANPVDPCGT